VIPHVVLIEDNADDVMLIRRAFRKSSFTGELVVIGDGEQAVEHLRTAKVPALVLLDVKLPRLSGHEVLAWIRRQPHLALVPVVMLTSSNDSGDVQRAYTVGVNSYLVKPVQSADLDRMVATLGLYWLEFNADPHSRRP
jgi:two-component system response regulator